MSERTAVEPVVSVTIVLHNSAAHLPACLGSIAAALDSGLAELIAVDNASPDDSAAVVKRLVPDARLLTAPRNLGFAGGCELARPFARGRCWLLLNPDAELEPDALRQLVETLDARPDVAAVSPWLRDGDRGAPAYPGRRFPSITLTLLELGRLHRLLPRRRRAALLLGSYVTGPDAHGRDPDWLPGTALLLRRAAVDRVGGLDPAFFLYGEDLEWCWRARAGGWRVAVADAAAAHRLSASSRATFAEQEVQDRIADGILRACRRHRGRRYAAAYAALTALALTLESRDRRRPGEVRAAAGIAARAWRRAGSAERMRPTT